MSKTMDKALTFLLLVGFVCVPAWAQRNLLPEPQIQENRSLGDAPGKWHRTYVNPNHVNATLTVGAISGNLEIRREGKTGSSGWRIVLKGISSGDYTLDTGVTCSSRAVATVYSFDDRQQVSLVLQKTFQPGENLAQAEVFSVPEGSENIRLEFAVLDNGVASWLKPRLFKGRYAKEELPAREEPKADDISSTGSLELLETDTVFQEVQTTPRNEIVLDPFTGMRVELDGGVSSHNANCRKNNDGSWVFRIRNRAVDISAAAWRLDFPRKRLSKGRLLEMTYRLKGLAYVRISYPALLLGEQPLLYSSELYSDGEIHRVLCLLPQDVEAENVSISLRTDADELSLELFSLRLFADVAALPWEQCGRLDFPAWGERIDFSKRVRRSQRALLPELLELRGKVYDYAMTPEGTVEMDGACFHLDSLWNVLEGVQAPPSAELDKREPESGLPWMGVGRAFDETIEIPLSGKAGELWLLLAARMTAFSRNGATPVMPPQFAAHEVISMEIRYEDGTVDKAYPYSLADKGYSIQRFTGAYAVPLNPRKTLSRAVLHSYFRPDQGSVYLMAATLNRQGHRLIPETVLHPAKQIIRQLPAPKAQALKVVIDDVGFTMENGWYSLCGTTENGFAVVSLEQKISPDEPLRMEKGGLEIDVNGKTMTGEDFIVITRQGLSDGMAFHLRSKKDAPASLELELRISGDDRSGEIRFNASLVNRGTARIAPRIRFPFLHGVQIGKNYAQNWLYFPKYYSLHTNETNTYAHSPANERAYFVQFMDAYNPDAGYGLELMTHNLEGTMMDYGLHKAEDGLRYYVQYPAQWQMMAPGESRRLSETSLLVHAGDWHQALKLYRQWCAGWYHPVKKEGLDWWRKSWIVRNEFFNKQYNWVLPVYLPDKDEFRFEAIRRLAERRWNEMPDIFHLWGWNVPPLYPGEKTRTGTPRANYADGEFDPKNYLAGAKRLVAIVRTQQEKGTHMSFYTIPSYLPKASPMGRTRGSEVTQILGDGQPLQDGQCYFPCPWVWADTFVAACVRAQKEIGFNALYIDISPFPRDYACYSTKHGHSVPLNVNLASRKILRRLREELPEGVALWHEDPACDVDTQWSSGSLTYYHVSGSENRAPNYAATTKAPLMMPPRQSILRYVFPRYKMFVIPVGLTSSSMVMRFYHAPFFNGEGIYDSTTGLYNERTIRVMRKAIAIQRKYADAFLSDNVEPLVETEAAGIYANRFESADGRETLWTLYNGKYETYRGSVLEVDYRPGDKFIDIWNNCPVQNVVKGNRATLFLEIDPQMVGAVARQSSSK
ncbi:MAG: hypothetical protein IJJ33_19820 [Victivallales bacterium]|nr:hypothetical protein [Victivallales bacterium]